VETPAALPPVAETTDSPIAEAEVAAPPVTETKVANPPVAETVDPLGDLRQARGWIDHMDERALWSMLVRVRPGLSGQDRLAARRGVPWLRRKRSAVPRAN
jgi:hypothetical protein